MKLDNWFSNFQLAKMRLGPHGANAEITFIESDKEAAWELYLEMLTRIVTNPCATAAGRRRGGSILDNSAINRLADASSARPSSKAPDTGRGCHRTGACRDPRR